MKWNSYSLLANAKQRLEGMENKTFHFESGEGRGEGEGLEIT
ncbi:MAG TPA: hypothetical protein VK590_14285 [Saprospiraceae bacterium]|nr:hypothetical protein [Saprospiraceae bacterium]